MKYELRESHGIPAPLLALMAVATGLSVANCYYNQPLLGSMAKDFGVSDFSASMVATLTQIGYVVGLVFVIPLGDLVSRKQLILTNYIISSCALLAIALALTSIGCGALPCLPEHLRLCRSSSSRWCLSIQHQHTRYATWGLYSPVCS